ncbi:hypothetical protein RBSWK_05199 [Rhodopirellula baltica SWK14]|uniref:Uncharacterized protein n=1 Tax=Rhodopirellula baltica SWK14 TaxID=993516 RepID=L7CA69_RHOBT|nr:hypothetical protein RBSWK_05199 [Rhodopirellula baltica SWK14]
MLINQLSMVGDVLLSRSVASLATDSKLSHSGIPLADAHFAFLRVRGMTLATGGIPTSNLV